MGIARNVEVWIFGAFGGLILAACLSEPAQRATPPAATAPAAHAPAEAGPAQPQAMEPTYVVYVTAKRPSAAAKSKMLGRAG